MFILILFVLFLNLNEFQAGSLRMFIVMYCVILIIILITAKYIKPCSKIDFNDCATKAAQEAIPKLLNGKSTIQIIYI